jgi:hypothetical protein
MKDDFDVDRLRIGPGEWGAFVPKARPQKWRRKFVKIPWSWVDALKGAKCVSSYRVAIYVVYEHWRGGGRPVKLSNVALAEMGVSRELKRRALRELGGLGLIKAECRPRRSPIVTPLFKGAEKS